MRKIRRKRKTIFRKVAWTAVGAALIVSPASPASAGEGTRFRPAVSGTAGVVASVNPLASEVGIQILNQGGNAIDAAVATVFAVGVVRPEMCGIGGGGLLVYRGADGTTAALDLRETAPADHVHSNGVAEGGPYAWDTGHNRVGVPGVVAGLSEALKRFGTLRLRDTIAPAADLARDGFPVSADLSWSMTLHSEWMKLFPETARTFLVDGARPYLPGERLVVRDLADALELIAQRGPSFGAPESANEPAGGKRPRSSMNPTIVVQERRPVLVVGAAGGAFIIAGIVQAIVNTIDFGMDVAHALDAERSDAMACPRPFLCMEWARVTPSVQAVLGARGHVVAHPYCPVDLLLQGPRRCDPEYHRWPELQAAGVTASGLREAVSDPRGEWGPAAQ